MMGYTMHREPYLFRCMVGEDKHCDPISLATCLPQPENHGRTHSRHHVTTPRNASYKAPAKLLAAQRHLPQSCIRDQDGAGREEYNFASTYLLKAAPGMPES